ncbi:MAG TPA: hypothetical protein PKJ98_18500 [Verrucomicrobiota bacterium]|nr:hypothetical protein [Verrucomicrobiota bacterium]
MSAGRYTVNVLRSQLGTTRGQQDVGAECWCVQLGELPLLEWSPPKDAVSVGLKVQPQLLHREISLADVAKITHSIQRRSLRPLGPANLTANGDGAHPTYASGQNVVLDWTLTSEARAGSDPEVDLDCRADACVLELWAWPASIPHSGWLPAWAPKLRMDAGQKSKTAPKTNTGKERNPTT